MNRFLRLLAVALLLTALGAHGATDSRVALVIGNDTYRGAPLKNPVNDARAMAVKLKQLGFDVIERHNLGSRQISSTLKEFRSRLTPGTEVAFFYAGHGLQVKGINYLPAVDADIAAEEDVAYQSINVNQILEIMEESKTRLNLIFLDACRNNPFSRRFRSSAEGLAKVNAPSGTLISFATRPGSVAADGEGQNGLYTEHLLRAIDQGSLPIEQVLKKVAAGVKRASHGQQEPWSEGMIEGEFYFIFNGPVAINSQLQAATHPRTDADREQLLWDRVKNTINPDELNDYLRAYPKGRFVTQAKSLVARLKLENIKPLAVQPATINSSRADSIEDAVWSEVKAGNTVGDYEAYLAEYPQGRYVALAKARMTRLTDETAEAARKEHDLWAVANDGETAAEVKAYLDKYPNGKYADAAQRKIAAIIQTSALWGTWVISLPNEPYFKQRYWLFNSKGECTFRQIANGAPYDEIYRYKVSGNSVSLTHGMFRQSVVPDKSLTWSITGDKLTIDAKTYTKM